MRRLIISVRSHLQADHFCELPSASSLIAPYELNATDITILTKKTPAARSPITLPPMRHRRSHHLRQCPPALPCKRKLASINRCYLTASVGAARSSRVGEWVTTPLEPENRN